MYFSNKGCCPICEKEVVFFSENEWFRDFYFCPICKSIPRERALMHVINIYHPNWRSLVIHETSPANRGTSEKLRKECKTYIASYYFPNIMSGSYYQGYLCENMEALSFQDNSIDIHISQDVFEHVLFPEKAFKEVRRTLKPGGAHIFTVPLVNKNNPSEMLATLNEEGKIVNLVTPAEYHGDPLSSNGSLVTRRWGYDITKFIHDTSGLFTTMIYIDNLHFGIRAEYVEVLVSIKNNNDK